MRLLKKPCGPKPPAIVVAIQARVYAVANCDFSEVARAEASGGGGSLWLTPAGCSSHLAAIVVAIQARVYAAANCDF